MQNTNVNGKHKVGFALRIIKGIGRRFAHLVCKIAQVDTNRRAGDLTEEEINKISDIFAKPTGKCLNQIVSARNGVLTPPLVFAEYRLRNSKVVLEQTEVHQGWLLLSDLLQHCRYQTQRGFGAYEEGPQP